MMEQKEQKEVRISDDQAAQDRWLGRLSDAIVTPGHEFNDMDGDTDAYAVDCAICDKVHVLGWQYCLGEGCGKKLCRDLVTCIRERQQWCDKCRVSNHILPPITSERRDAEEAASSKSASFHYPRKICEQAARFGIAPCMIEKITVFKQSQTFSDL